MPEKIDIQAIRSYINEVISEDGLVSIGRLLSEAEEADSPLNSYFEWDDCVAAHNWRVQQIKNLQIRHQVLRP